MRRYVIICDKSDHPIHRTAVALIDLSDAFRDVKRTAPQLLLLADCRAASMNSTDEGYTLTLAGRYVWKQYGPDTEDLDSDADGNEASSEKESEDQEEEETGDNESGNSTSDVDLSNFEMKE